MRKPPPPIPQIMQLSMPHKQHATDKQNHAIVDAAQTKATDTNNHDVIDVLG